MQIFAKSLDGRNLTLDVNKDEFVESLKLQICSKTSVTSDNQRLVFAGKQLQNGHRISEYNIGKESTLHLSGALKGGAGSLAEQEEAIVNRTVRALVALGFAEGKAQKAVMSIGDPSDTNLAMNWLFDHGEEDKGGAVQIHHCPHVDEMGPDCLVTTSKLHFGRPCVHGCRGDENWVCLHCGESRCGRYGNRHSLEHWQGSKQDDEKQITVAQAASGRQARGHCLALSLSDLSVWCYECDGYVKHHRITPLVEAMEALKFGRQNQTSEACTFSTTRPNAAVGSPIPADALVAHGWMGKVEWALPTLARACEEEARPGYKTMKAHEYLEHPEVLKEKVKLLASLIRRSANCIAYTGAGISTASGIDDYATKADDSVAGTGQKISPWEAQPTLAHRALVGLYHAGHLKHWVQQNHDGLPQKAGFPQKDINEIHGAWFDPSNPVVPMSGTLRQDLIEQMLHWEERTDFCLALGTSMVGMNADRMAVSVAQRARKGTAGAIGTVIVSLQQTQYDAISSLRIFAKIDQVMEMLMEELSWDIPPAPARQPCTDALVLKDLPYGEDGKRSATERLILDLRPGSKLRIVNQPGWDREVYGNIAEVTDSPGWRARGHINLVFGKPGSAGAKTRILGWWWLKAAIEGTVEYLPVIPCE